MHLVCSTHLLVVVREGSDDDFPTDMLCVVCFVRSPQGFIAEIMTPSFVADPVNVHPVIASVAAQGSVVTVSAVYSCPFW